jgi:hypothetical protein
MGDEPAHDSSPDPVRAYRVGVLFVHGIGEQRRGETLTQCAEPIFHALSAWSAAGPAPAKVTMGPAPLDDDWLLGADSRGEPWHVVLTSAPADAAPGAAGEPPEPSRWLLAESWWAARFVPPTMAQLFGWSLRLAVRAARQLVLPRATELRRYANDVRERAPAEAWKGAADAAAGTFMGIVSSEPDVIHWPGADEVPIDDTVTVTEDDLRDELVLVAGEGLASLTPIASSALAGTFGFHVTAGLTGAAYVGAVGGWILAVVGLAVVGPIAVVVAAAVTIAVRVAGMLPKVGGSARALQTRVAASVGDAYVWQRSPVRHTFLVGQLEQDLTWLAARCDKVALFAHSQGSAITHAYLRSRTVPENLVLYVTYGTAIRLLNAEGRTTESNDGLQEVDLAIPGQGDARRWLDFAATLDPVAVEPLPDAPGRTGIRVRNDYSVFKDHTGYWRNTEEFVLPVALQLAGLDRCTPLAGPDPEGAELVVTARSRRRWRGGQLGCAAVSAFVALMVPWLLSIGWWRERIVAATGFLEKPISLLTGIDGFTFPSWTSGTAATLYIAALGMIAAWVVWMAFVRTFFRRWDDEAAAALLQRRLPAKRTWTAYALIALVPTPVVASVVLLVTHLGDRPDPESDPSNVIIVVSVLLLFLTMFAWVRSKPATAEEDMRKRAEAEWRKRRDRGAAELAKLPPQVVAERLLTTKDELTRRVRLRRTITASREVRPPSDPLLAPLLDG